MTGDRNSDTPRSSIDGVLLQAALLVALLLAVACGGARFGLGPVPSDDSGEGSAPNTIDAVGAVDDAGVDAEDAQTEVDLKLHFDSASRDVDSGEDAAIDAGVDVNTPGDAVAPDSSASCTPIPPSGHTCGMGTLIVTPTEYCAQNPTGGNRSFVVSMPKACQCAETWGCACLEAQGNPCKTFGSYDGSFSGCNDSPGFIAVACP